jgi:hypothetical protein
MDQLDQYIKLQIGQKKHKSFKNDVQKLIHCINNFY